MVLRTEKCNMSRRTAIFQFQHDLLGKGGRDTESCHFGNLIYYIKGKIFTKNDQVGKWHDYI